MIRIWMILVLEIIITSNLIGQSHEGTEFWFGFMEHRDVGNNTMVAMITSTYNTSGIIKIPLNGWEKNFTINANEVHIIELPKVAETLGSENISQNGIQIITQKPSSVYIHQYHGARSEATAILPINSSGNTYYVMSYTGITHGGIDYLSEFLVVAFEDNTIIEITPNTKTAGGNYGNKPFKITLDAGETYQVQAFTTVADLTGTFLKGNRNFALFSGNEWTQVPSQCSHRDNLLEQMYPVDTWGKQYISLPFAQNPYDVYRILASENNTQVLVELDSKTDTFTIDRGEFIELKASSAIYIKGSNPIMVAQYLIGVQCSEHPIGDPSMVLLNSLAQTRDTLTFFSSSFKAIEENYINLVAMSQDIDQLKLDGQSILDMGITFNTIGIDPTYAYTTIKVTPGSHTLTSSGCGVSAIAYGYGNAESYAYSGGSNFNKLVLQPLPQTACQGDVVIYDPGISTEKYNFYWDLGNGESSRGPVVKHAYKEPGIYQVKLIAQNNCNFSEIKFEHKISILPVYKLKTTSDQIVCEGEDISLQVDRVKEGLYYWEGPIGFSSIQPNLIIKNADTSMSGNYIVNAWIDDCPAIPDTTIIEVAPTPQPNLGLDTTICSYDGEKLLLNPGTFDSYLWDDQTSYSTTEIYREGIYGVTVSNTWGCSGTDTIIISEQCAFTFKMPNAFSPNGDQINDVFAPISNQIQKLHLKIFDNWGRQVFETQKIDGGWDGKDFQGNDASEGVYFWSLVWEGMTLEGKNQRQQLQGSVWLVR